MNFVFPKSQHRELQENFTRLKNEVGTTSHSFYNYSERVCAHQIGMGLFFQQYRIITINEPWLSYANYPNFPAKQKWKKAAQVKVHEIDMCMHNSPSAVYIAAATVLHMY